MNIIKRMRVNSFTVLLRIKTSNCISRIVWFGTDAIGIEKNALAYFFQRGKRSGVAVTQPAG